MRQKALLGALAISSAVILSGCTATIKPYVQSLAVATTMANAMTAQYYCQNGHWPQSVAAYSTVMPANMSRNITLRPINCKEQHCTVHVSLTSSGSIFVVKYKNAPKLQSGRQYLRFLAFISGSSPISASTRDRMPFQCRPNFSIPRSYSKSIDALINNK